MAVRLMSVKAKLTAEDGVTKIVGTVFADSKADITSNLTIDGDLIDSGSVAYTKNFEVAILGSDGEWVWQE